MSGSNPGAAEFQRTTERPQQRHSPEFEKPLMMSAYIDPVFGPLNEEADGQWVTVLRFGGRPVSVYLNIEDEIDATAVRRLSSQLQDLPKLDALARSAMAREAEAGESAVSEYRIHHEKELSPADLERCFVPREFKRGDDQALVAALKLKSISLYPDDHDQSIVMDFTLGEKVTDYVLAVALDCAGLVTVISFES